MNLIGFQNNYDCYGCISEIINNQVAIEQLIWSLCKEIGAQIVKSDISLFSPQGISAYAIITASHIGIHTWPEYQFASIDIFSCKGEIPDSVVDIIKNALHAKEIEIQKMQRGDKFDTEGINKALYEEASQ